MFRQMTIGVRAAAAFGVIGLLVLLLGLFSINRLSAVNEDFDQVTGKQIPAVLQVDEINRLFLQVRIQAANVSANINSPERLRTYRQRLDSAIEELKASTKAYDKLIQDSDVRRSFEQWETMSDEYWTYNNQFYQLVDAKLEEPIASLRENQVLPLTNKMNAVLGDILQRELALIKEASAAADDAASAAYVGITVALVVALVLLTLFAVSFTRSIVGPIRTAVDFAKTIAARDLTQHIEIEGTDEPAQLLKQLRITQEELRNSVGEISHSSEQLASTSEELSAVTDESTRTIQQQSEELEQAATAVTELTTAIETVAQDAQSASGSSDAADEQAQQGDDRVRRTVTAIEELSQEIGDASNSVTELAGKVTDITKVLEVIRGIAEQTNLLALNAAIEAARAGESGRGFAVVADEVRSLAHKTQQSTVEIEDMVKAINSSSERSVSTMDASMSRAARTLEIAREAGEALKQIAYSVSEINTHNTSIASAAEEQANVARDVDKNLLSIRDLSNSTASGAQQTSASSQELSRLAMRLNELVERFKIN